MGRQPLILALGLAAAVAVSLAVALLAGNLLAAILGTVAARTRPAALLRAG